MRVGALVEKPAHGSDHVEDAVGVVVGLDDAALRELAEVADFGEHGGADA